jgi:hypothetical protein
MITAIHYSYEVSNGAYARQSIQKISLLVAPDSSLHSSHPSWTSKLGASKLRDITSPGTDLTTVEWTSNSSSQVIAPGSKLGGFHVDSTLLPGFTTMIFSGATQSREYSPDAVVILPSEVRDQIARVFTAAWDVKTRPVIGPRFPRTASQTEIAQNLLFGIQSLTRERQLDSKSPFVQSAIASLTAQLEAGGPDVVNPDSISFEKSKPGMELTVANALQAALVH